MHLLRSVAALLACSLLLPIAAPCAALAKRSSTLPCCASPAKKGCAVPAVASTPAGCCSTAPGEALRLVPGADRPATLDVPAAVSVTVAVDPLAPREIARCTTLTSTQHDILRL
ncbi:MAG TPA: hypothetical protein VGS57_03085 [Thermoanaerobaculia bacterium]|nr:hypothetical protein [Thermoanaerobaculia bacterium]